MILGFKSKYVPMIKSGRKVHTIRRDPHCRWQPGRIIHFVANHRKQNQITFLIGTCHAVQHIDIIIEGGIRIFVDGKLLTYAQSLDLAICDGFDTLPEMEEFFPKGLNDFKLIHWTNITY